MRRLTTIVCALLLSAVPALGAPVKKPAMPDTLAGKRATALIKAINSGDEAAIRQFELDHRAESMARRRPLDDRVAGWMTRHTEWGKLEVRNGHRRPIKVELHEQVPQTTRNDVKVTWDVAEGGPTPEEKDGGLLEFAFDLAAGTKKSFVWGYEVDYPTDVYLGWME